MASLDARPGAQLAIHGEALLERTISASMDVRRQIEQIDGVAVVGPDMACPPAGVGRPWDPLRVVIVNVRGTGCHRLRGWLRRCAL